MAAILKTFASLNFYTQKTTIIYLSKWHQTMRSRPCWVNKKFELSWSLAPGYNEYQSMFWNSEIRIKCPYIPQFHYIKLGSEGVYITRICFPDVFLWISNFKHRLHDKQLTRTVIMYMIFCSCIICILCKK